MKISQEDLLQLAITDHLLWRWRVYNLILGFEQMDESEVTSHEECRLGKWYYGIAKKLFGEERCYIEVEQPHIRIHQLARDAVKAVNERKYEKAEQYLMEITDTSDEVMEKLYALKHYIIQQKEQYKNNVHSYR